MSIIVIILVILFILVIFGKISELKGREEEYQNRRKQFVEMIDSSSSAKVFLMDDVKADSKKMTELEFNDKYSQNKYMRFSGYVVDASSNEIVIKSNRAEVKCEKFTGFQSEGLMIEREDFIEYDNNLETTLKSLHKGDHVIVGGIPKYLKLGHIKFLTVEKV